MKKLILLVSIFVLMTPLAFAIPTHNTIPTQFYTLKNATFCQVGPDPTQAYRNKEGVPINTYLKTPFHHVLIKFRTIQPWQSGLAPVYGLLHIQPYVIIGPNQWRASQQNAFNWGYIVSYFNTHQNCTYQHPCFMVLPSLPAQCEW